MSFVEQLAAPGAWAEHEKTMDLYGRLVGTWDVTNRYRSEATGEWLTGTVVWTFGWVLAGHTVQDVMWFTQPGPDGYPERLTGSTVRHYDPTLDAWHIVWFSPTGRVTRLTGRPGPGGDIVQEGERPAGHPIRWLFTDVTGTTFRWLGYEDRDLTQEMLARRRPGTAAQGEGQARGQRIRIG